MQLENLGLLEESLDRLIRQFLRLKEEKSVLENRLEETSRRLKDLEGEIEGLRQERGLIRERLGRALKKIERLEFLETGEAGR
jgi:cell division protein FtsB